ncbi:SDR family oxidoreductase [Chryseolinea lacunae]|uniref:SDR family oxidoreductase n=1 Tax=Chryseolinea lacunae TaxID=2801331 RepID=A0ABS1L419_9BACT|nr:SDR family oxidoreductase [Chryseolinea lacunae]MBL0745687.1 SDR family oxidoreductase [Chryseolinea lacunae]
MKTLENKTAVITGGNSGIGLSTAILFAEQGAKVGITGRNQATLDQAVNEIKHGAIAIQADVSNVRSITDSYEQLHSKLGKFDVLIVNAGLDVSGPFDHVSEADFDKVSDVNFKGAFFSIQKALPFLNNGASVVLTSSAVNEKGFPGVAVYSATKAAVRSLARTLSQELSARNIRVNVLSPGAIDTPFFSRGGASDEQVAGIKDYMATIIPAKRLGSSSEIANGFLFLASDHSKYMLGAEIVMDGGVKTL